MKFTNEQRQLVLRGYQNASDSTDLNNAVYSNNKDIVHQMIKDALIQNGFPKDVELKRVQGIKFNVTIKDFEYYIKKLESNGKIEENTFEALINTSNFYINDILEDLSATNIEITWSTQLEEYLADNENSNKDISVKDLQQIIEKRFSRGILEEHLRENEYFLETVLENKAREEGFTNTKTAKKHYSIRNLQLKYPASSLAELYIGTVNANYASANDFMRKDFYKYIVKERLYIPDIKFDIDPKEEETY